MHNSQDLCGIIHDILFEVVDWWASPSGQRCSRLTSHSIIQIRMIGRQFGGLTPDWRSVGTASTENRVRVGFLVREERQFHVC